MRISWRSVGHRFRVVQIALGITEQDAADASGVSLRTYRRYENGDRQRCSSFVGFSGKFNVSVDWLILGEGTGLARHLVRHAPRKIVILPVEGRNLWARRSAA